MDSRHRTCLLLRIHARQVSGARSYFQQDKHGEDLRERFDDTRESTTESQATTEQGDSARKTSSQLFQWYARPERRSKHHGNERLAATAWSLGIIMHTV